MKGRGKIISKEGLMPLLNTPFITLGEDYFLRRASPLLNPFTLLHPLKLITWGAANGALLGGFIGDSIAADLADKVISFTF